MAPDQAAQPSGYTSWQIAILAVAAVAVFIRRRGLGLTLIAAGAAGALASVLGQLLPY